MSENKTYIAIDLKSFFASVECVRRSLDPLTTNLIVADPSRTEKTICLAVTPSLKAYGISGRARMFEVIAKTREINNSRRLRNTQGNFEGASFNDAELRAHPELALDYIVAKPRMALYKKTSVKIYEIYLKYVSPDDIHVYSVDEVFIDATQYLDFYKTTARDLARTMILDVLRETGITATAGIGSNLYLCKVALDIMAKHIPEDENGVRIAELDERTYRRELWAHRPITDFWRVGCGYAERLKNHGMNTMGDVARCSLINEDLLYNLFGVNAELLIDHAWGWEPCTIAAIKAYRPQSSSSSSGQVLGTPYTFESAMVILKEMTEASVLDIVERGLVTDRVVIDVGYEISSSTDDAHGSFELSASDRYGRKMPKPARGTVILPSFTSSTRQITNAVVSLFDRTVDHKKKVRRLTVTFCNLCSEEDAFRANKNYGEQIDIFTDHETLHQQTKDAEALRREKCLQHTVIEIKKRHGKNAIIKGLDLEEYATTRERNNQIGGHKA